MNGFLTGHHIGRQNVVSAERTAPDSIGDLGIAAGHRPSHAAGDTAKNAVSQFGGNVQNVADCGAGADADAFPVDARVALRLRHLRLRRAGGTRQLQRRYYSRTVATIVLSESTGRQRQCECDRSRDHRCVFLPHYPSLSSPPKNVWPIRDNYSTFTTTSLGSNPIK